MNTEQAINAADEAEGLRGREPVAWMVEESITVREDFASMLGWAGAVVGTGRAIPCSWRPMLYASWMETDMDHAEKCMKACDGPPDGALDGGWTAAGMSAYTAKLEQALKPFAEHPEFQAPEDWPVTILRRLEPTGEPVAGVTAGDFRRAKAAMRHTIELTALPKAATGSTTG